MEERLNAFLEKNSLIFLQKISKGYSSEVFLVVNSIGKKFALKTEKDKSPRKNMVQKEACNLVLANSVGIGPRLEKFDEKNKCVLLEFVDGKTFSDWLFESNPSEKVLEKFVKELLAQAEMLDILGLSHGQLAGKGKNILVRKNLPVIIDFEKASSSRKAKNLNQAKSLLFNNPNSLIARKVQKVLGNKKSVF